MSLRRGREVLRRGSPAIDHSCRIGGRWLDIRGGLGEGGWGDGSRGRGRGDWGEQGWWVEERRDWEEDRWAGG